MSDSAIPVYSTPAEREDALVARAQHEQSTESGMRRSVDLSRAVGKQTNHTSGHFAVPLFVRRTRAGELERLIFPAESYWRKIVRRPAQPRWVALGSMDDLIDSKDVKRLAKLLARLFRYLGPIWPAVVWLNGKFFAEIRRFGKQFAGINGPSLEHGVEKDFQGQIFTHTTAMLTAAGLYGDKLPPPEPVPLNSVVDAATAPSTRLTHAVGAFFGDTTAARRLPSLRDVTGVRATRAGRSYVYACAIASVGPIAVALRDLLPVDTPVRIQVTLTARRRKTNELRDTFKYTTGPAHTHTDILDINLYVRVTSLEHCDIAKQPAEELLFQFQSSTRISTGSTTSTAAAARTAAIQSATLTTMPVTNAATSAATTTNSVSSSARTPRPSSPRPGRRCATPCAPPSLSGSIWQSTSSGSGARRCDSSECSSSNRLVCADQHQLVVSSSRPSPARALWTPGRLG